MEDTFEYEKLGIFRFMNIKETEYFKEEKTKVIVETRLPDLEGFTLLDLIPLTLFQDISIIKRELSLLLKENYT